MKIVWREVPPEVRNRAEPLLKRWRGLIPGWCERLTVFYKQDEGNIASMNSRPEYRRATLLLHGSFLDDDDNEDTIIHELAHIAFEPVRDVWLSTLSNALKGQEAITNMAEEEYRRAMEGCMCDLAAGIQRVSK